MFLRGIGFHLSLGFGLAFYIQLSSFRMASRALSEIHKVSKTAVGSGFWKFSERVNVNPSRIPRRLIALDET